MANIKHSKFRNSGIIFDLLVRQITSDTITGKNSPALDILKEYFTNNELAKEYKLYNILTSSKVLNESKANMLIETTVNLYKKLNKTELKKQRYNLIKEIKGSYNLEDFCKAKIPNYKLYAAAFTLFESTSSKTFLNPEILVKNKVSLLEHITKQPAAEDTKDRLMEEYLSSDKGTRFLTYTILVNKFNSRYSNLDNTQKEILREYINNISNTNNLKEYINIKFDSFKKELKPLIQRVDDEVTKIKLMEVLKLIKPIEKNETVKDDDVLNLLQYSQLINELKMKSNV
jgi:hypothetical protein